MATKTIDGYDGERESGWPGAVADGAGCTPMTSGIHYWELELAKSGAHAGSRSWCFGVCRPEIDLDADKDYEDEPDFVGDKDTWMMHHSNHVGLELYCSTCKGTGGTVDPAPEVSDGFRMGLLLDLDNGGTLTMYLDNRPCGTIADGLVGPLLPCTASGDVGNAVKIYGGLAPPQ